jgi:hypothetical protein
MNDRLPPTSATIKVLWSRCGNTCAKCKDAVTENNSNGGVIVVGEMCHIVAVKPNEARYRTTLTDEQKRQPSNLIILCGSCHTIIDADEAQYPIEYLSQLKVDHENWFMSILRAKMPEITFQELESITQHLLALPVNGEDYTLTAPLEKITKNGLSNESAQLIRLGSAQSNLVRDYVEAHTTTGFDEKLRAGFVKRYSELKVSGMSPDEIFIDMKDFATAKSIDARMVAAGLAVVAYYFETCDIFEK